MPEPGGFDYRAIDDIIHSRIRLSVMAILASVEAAEFTFLRDRVGTTDGNLSTHVSRLVEAGYVDVQRVLDRRKAVSRYRLTTKGRDAFRNYVDRMERMLAGTLE